MPMTKTLPAQRSVIENRTFDEVTVGESVSSTRVLSRRDVDLFALVSDDDNPLHEVIGSGMWGGALISGLLGSRLPGPGTAHLSQDLTFQYPIAIGDTITTTVTAVEKKPTTQQIVFDCRCVNQAGQVVIMGRAEVRAPKEKNRLTAAPSPSLKLARHERLRTLQARAKAMPRASVAVAHPCDEAALLAAAEMSQAQLAEPILVGPTQKIKSAAADASIDISAFTIVDVPHSHAAAARAVELIHSGQAQLLMKGSLHTDELLHEVVASKTGLRTGRRLSHVYFMDVPDYPRPLLITDAAVNIKPSLLDKRDIIQNAIELAHLLGIALPKVAILGAVEMINPVMETTLDAAALCKMADRGQITGAILDGPLAFDNAISVAAAQEKGIVSPVAGLADILVVPDLEAGNMLAKQLTFLAGADAAGIVLGAQVPIILTSRADSERTRMASCALAVLVAQAKHASEPTGKAPINPGSHR